MLSNAESRILRGIDQEYINISQEVSIMINFHMTLNLFDKNRKEVNLL